MRHRAASVLPGHERPGVAQPDLPQALSARWRSGHSAGQGHGAGSSCCSQGGEPCCCEASAPTAAASARMACGAPTPTMVIVCATPEQQGGRPKRALSSLESLGSEESAATLFSLDSAAVQGGQATRHSSEGAACGADWELAPSSKRWKGDTSAGAERHHLQRLAVLSPATLAGLQQRLGERALLSFVGGWMHAIAAQGRPAAAAAVLAPPCVPASRQLPWTAVDLMASAARLLGCTQASTLQLAAHCWRRVQVLCPSGGSGWEELRPEEAPTCCSGADVERGAVVTLVWLASKCEEPRSAVAKVAAATPLLPASLAPLGPRAVTSLELVLMQLLDWSPYAGWAAAA